MVRRLILPCAVTALLLLMSPVARATTLTTPVSGATVSAGSVAGTVLADFVQTFNFGVGDAGSVEAAAVASTANPFGSGDISFVFQFTVTGGLVEHLTDGNLSGAGIDVEQAASVSLSGTTFGTGTVSATGADRLVDSTVAFDFANGVLPTETSYVLIINTDQTIYSGGDLGIIDAGAQQLEGFSTTPEPASMALALAGLPLLAVGRWIRRRK